MLAHGTAFNVLSHELCKTWPSELEDNELASFKITGMASSLMIMAAGEDEVLERVHQGNIDMTFVCQDVVIEFPVGETRPKGGGDVLQGRL